MKNFTDFKELKIKSDQDLSLGYKIRSFIYKRFKIWDIFDLFPYSFRMWYYDKITPIIDPSHCRIRKSIPKQWKDISTLIVDVNFEMIKSFYEEEYLKIDINWNACEEQKKFSNWLKRTYKYITKDRIDLEKNIENAYPKHDFKNFLKRIKDSGEKTIEFNIDKRTYKEKYGEVDRLEKMLRNKDTKVLTEMVQYREFFWT